MNEGPTDQDSAPSKAYAALLIDWFAESGRDLPWREAGFTPWGTLVSEFMLQQTPVTRVIPRLADWLERWPTPAHLAAEPAGEAVRAWQSLGYPRRALYLHACAVAITERHDGVVPSDVPQLLALPGVGDYTARAVAAFAYGHRHPVVDTNTRRVIARSRAGLSEAAAPSTRRDLAAMSELLPAPRQQAHDFNAAIMELGAIVCTARRPECDICPIAALCAWKAAGFPQTSAPRKAIQKKFEGSDRQVRGLIMAALRASEDPVPMSVVDLVWSDQTQRERALAGLLADGLAVAIDGACTLPS